MEVRELLINLQRLHVYNVHKVYQVDIPSSKAA